MNPTSVGKEGEPAHFRVLRIVNSAPAHITLRASTRKLLHVKTFLQNHKMIYRNITRSSFRRIANPFAKTSVHYFPSGDEPHSNRSRIVKATNRSIIRARLGAAKRSTPDVRKTCKNELKTCEINLRSYSTKTHKKKKISTTS